MSDPPPLGAPPDPLDAPEDELRFHLDRQVEELVAAGWDEEEARAEAERRFGDPVRVRRELERMGRRRRRMAHRSHWREGARQDLAFSFRQMRRRPGFAAATVLVIALGVGVAASVFAVADAALLRPLPFADPGELVALQDVQDGPGYPASLPEFRDWEREGDFLAAAAALTRSSRTLLAGDVPERVEVGFVAGDLAGVLGGPLVLGRGFATEERARGADAAVALVDEGFWRSRLAADPEVVGRSFTLDGEPVVVVGVAPAAARLFLQAPELAFWRPMPDLPMFTRGFHLLRVVGRTAPGVDPETARSRAEVLAAGLREAGTTTHGLSVVPLRDVLMGDVHRTVAILAGAVALVLLVVCANLAHLFLARGRARSREFAVRGAVGAGRGRVVRQLLTEATVLAVLGAVGGLALARALTGWVAGATDGSAVADLVTIDARVGLFALTLSAAIGLLFGWMPARRAAGADPARELRGGAPSGGPDRARASRMLVGAEVALCTVLLASAGLLIGTVERLLDEDVGFDARGVLTGSLVLPGGYATPEDRIAFWAELRERLAAMPGVEYVGLGSHLPLLGDTYGDFEIAGRTYAEDEEPEARKRFADAGYFEAMGIPVLRGRGFLPSDRRGEPEVALISASLAERYWPGENPVGQRIRFLWRTEDEQTIVGVVGDVRGEALDVTDAGTIYLAQNQIGTEAMSVVLKASVPPATLAEPLRRAVLAVDPGLPVHDVATLEAIVRDSVADRATVMELLAAFAALSLLLAAVGVYAVAAQAVHGSTREIGLRMAVGAPPAGVVGRILARELAPVVAGLALGLVAAVQAGRALSGWLHEVRPGDPVTLGAVALTLLAAAALALLVPTLRALRVDPVEALRSD